MEYSIRNVFDEATGEAYDAHVNLKGQKGFEFRKQFHSSNQVLRCPECKEKATVFISHGRVFFRHFPNTPYCFLKDPGFTAAERKEIEQHIANRESERHKRLKRELGNYLKSTDGVNANTVAIDDRFLKDHLEKRRPDVFCEYNDLKIAFEVQLSRLPAKYIFKRHEFYQRNEIYLVWVLDDFNPKNTNQTARDIKYLNAHQNYFSFNDHATPASFTAHFKEGLINHRNEAYYEWNKQTVSLSELKFDKKEYQVFYVSFADEERETQEEIYRSSAEKQVTRPWDVPENIIITPEMEKKIKPALKLLRTFFITDKENYIPFIDNEIENLDFKEFNALSQKVFKTEDSALFFRLVQGEGKPYFLKYLLSNNRFDKHLNTKNSEGQNLLEAVLSHPKLLFRQRIIQLMFANGYKLTGSDNNYITSCVIPHESRQEREMRIIKIHAYNYLKKLHMIEIYDKLEGAIMVMLTAKHNKIIGFGFKNFIEVANNAIHNYKNVWHYIERVLRHYKRWDVLIESDTKGTFREKLRAYQEGDAEKNYEAEAILIRLFPVVFAPSTNNSEWFHLGLIE
ncbi:MAG TPA: hypothetical protein DHV26_06055 [Cytophagales bacterium]|nr:hypothetical protein [Cytophagales bacterium]